MEVRGESRTLFAAMLLLMAGTLNVIYGIAAIANSHYFAENSHFVFSNLNTWGWVTVIVAAIQVTGGVSLLGGGTYGRVIGITAASLGAIVSLLAVAGPNPFWALGVFALSLIVLHGLIVYGSPAEAR